MRHSQDDGLSLPIDRAALAVISNGEAATEHKLLRIFCKTNALDAAALDAALRQRDGAGAIRAAHRLLGASRMAGATALGALCANIVQAGHAADWDAITRHRDALCHELERINTYLDSEFSDLR